MEIDFYNVYRFAITQNPHVFNYVYFINTRNWKKCKNQGFKIHSLEMSNRGPVIPIPLDENDSEALKNTENMQVFFKVYVLSLFCK